MNILRRRNAASSSASSNTGTPSHSDAPQTPSNNHTDYRILPAQKLNEITHKQKGSKRQKAWIFGLGGIFGIVIAALFANQNQMLDLAMLQDLNLESIMDVLPAGFMREARDFQVSQCDIGKLAVICWTMLTL
jgi:phospholipid:diacylglycerol acyltransferase